MDQNEEGGGKLPVRCFGNVSFKLNVHISRKCVCYDSHGTMNILVHIVPIVSSMNKLMAELLNLNQRSKRAPSWR